MDTNEATWKHFKDEWRAKRSPSMDAETFNLLFQDGDISREAIEIIRNSTHAWKTIDKATAEFDDAIISELGDHDRFAVWAEVRGRDAVDKLIVSGLARNGSVATRAQTVERMVRGAVSHFGREWARTRLYVWWHTANLVEEEKEALLEALASTHVLHSTLLRQLGVEAVAMVRQLIARGDIDEWLLEPVSSAELYNVQGTQPANPLGPRIGALLQEVLVNLEIRDACLRPDEIAAVTTRTAPSDRRSLKFLHRAIAGLSRLPYRERREVAAGLEAFGGSLLRWKMHDDGGHSIGFPLIRFLHLRLLLDAPSLASALASPQEHAVPEVLLHTLGRDDVAYTPELRVKAQMDNRWRSRWVELAGEAMAVMYLESVVKIDLSQLARIPETVSQQTADFRVLTTERERIVFECKGATSWKTHLAQRKKALVQIGVTELPSDRGRRSIVSEGRAFAIAFFAAQQGQPNSTLLHVNDPPFPFDEVFSEGSEDRARREHYAAVLQMAGLDYVAENLLSSRESKQPPEAQTFTIDSDSTAGEEQARFAGQYLPVRGALTRLRLRDAQWADSFNVFVGVYQPFYSQLMANRLPDAYDPEFRRPNITLPQWGTLPGRRVDEAPRGVFSLLADGSFMAVELK